MHFLLALLAIAVVIHGVITSSPLWVISGAIAIAILASGRVWRVKHKRCQAFL